MRFLYACFFPTYLFRMFYVVYFDGGTAHINQCHTMLYLFTLFYCKVTLWGMSMSDVLINTALIQFKLSSSSLPEHRVLTTVFHSLRSCALCLASRQEIPYVRSSVSRLLLQVVVGRPRLRFHWGFQSSACLVMLVGTRRRVCPTHHHFRSLMASGIGLCCVLLQSSSLEIVSGHLIRRICRRQVFIFL